MLCILHTDICHAFYNMKSLCRHENVFLDTFLSYLYFPLFWVWPYWGVYHNNATHISSQVVHYAKKYKDTFLSCPCRLVFIEYDNHEVLQNPYTFQACDLIFCHTFCFVCCGFSLWVVSDEDPAMLTRNNPYFVIYATLTTTHYLVPGRHILQLRCQNVT